MAARAGMSGSHLHGWLVMAATMAAPCFGQQFCTVPQVPDSDIQSILSLQHMNCEKVLAAAHQANSLTTFSKSAQKALIDRCDDAVLLCKESEQKLDTLPYQATQLALNAWSGITSGRECCDRLALPFCLAPQDRLLHFFPALVAMCAFVIFSCTPLLCKKKFSAPRLCLRASPEQLPVLAAEAESEGRGKAVNRIGLEGKLSEAQDRSLEAPPQFDVSFEELQSVWLGGGQPRRAAHCLEALPEAKIWAARSSKLFAYLGGVFEFQADNVRNQFENLLSLWYWQVCMLADKNYANSVADRRPSEDPEQPIHFLRKALAGLHTEMLEGFQLWREKLYKDRTPPPYRLGGLYSTTSCQWLHEKAEKDMSDADARRLMEIAVYLLVWGEAGNLRFMPEVLYFLMECMLTSRAPLDGQGFYGTRPSAGSDRDVLSGRFLAVIVRPIYNAIFNANYEKVGIDAKPEKLKLSHSNKVLKGKPSEERGRVTDALDPKPKFQADDTYEARAGADPNSVLIDRDRKKKQETWKFEPVGFSGASCVGTVYRIRWNYDPSYCLHVHEDDTKLTMRKVDEKQRARQLFGRSNQRIVWFNPGSPDRYITCEGTFASLKPDTAGRTNQEIAFEGVDEEGKDAAVLVSRCKDFMPPDMTNYDDVNEVFVKTEELRQRLIFFGDDELQLFSRDAAWHFSLLRAVDWQTSIGSVKTHREVHSWWGAFASIHRVFFLHFMVYFGMVVWLTTKHVHHASTLTGTSRPVAMSILALMVSVYGYFLKFAVWATKGQVHAGRSLQSCRAWAWSLVTMAAWLVPAASYIAVRYFDTLDDSNSGSYLTLALVVCYTSLAIACIVVLFPVAVSSDDKLFEMSRAPILVKLVRYAFWIITFGAKAVFGYFLISILNNAIDSMLVGHFLRDTHVDDLMQLFHDPGFLRDFLQWALLWGTGFLLFLTDTQLWYVASCTVLGLVLGFAHRSWGFIAFCTEDAVAQIPKRFSEKVLKYNFDSRGGRVRYNSLELASWFPYVWDRIIDHMRYEDKLPNMSDTTAKFTFRNEEPDDILRYERLGDPVQRTEEGRNLMPEFFSESRCCAGQRNSEAAFRFAALSRCLSFDLPRPFRVPYIPGLTVLVPHYGEEICTSQPKPAAKAQAYGENLPLLEWIKQRYDFEFQLFENRMKATRGWRNQRRPLCEYDLGTQWRLINMWATMRQQTLWRTISGMMLYDLALRMHKTVQGDCREGDHKRMYEAWQTKHSFTCLLAMQMYKYFNKTQLDFTEQMLKKFPENLQIAFIDSQWKGLEADHELKGSPDGVHPAQVRRYYACLIDRECQQRRDPVKGTRRVPRLRIELPGYPVLGDGKGDNQNTAIIFSRGAFIQCIDANQGGYFEQWCLFPCALGEFRDEDVHPWGVQACYRYGASPARSKKILGFPEHIFSDIGSIGTFAASSEFAFGTILQRAMAALGGRMHYGHPDIMSKVHMMQQGGVSKATKTTNLSEDIFAGMDWTLRGACRRVIHREYFLVAKGRDMGFSQVLAFFMKLSSGSGEVALTRQSARLGRLLDLPEFLTFFYAHVGYYLTQFLISKCPVVLTFVWLLLCANDAEPNWKAMDPRLGLQDTYPSNARTAKYFLSHTFSWVVLLFMFSSMLPYLVEVWMQQGLRVTIGRFLKNLATLAPLHFIFQGKVIGIYATSELQRGGATYLATGRGLPTARVHVIGLVVTQDGDNLKKTWGLYNEFANIAFYDGVRLLGAFLLALIAGGVKSTDSELAVWLAVLLLCIVSWLWTPFIFNPCQFDPAHFTKDWTDIWSFFTRRRGQQWEEWYETKQLRKGTGIRATVLDVLYWCFLISVWFSAVDAKVQHYDMLLPASLWRWLPKCPPGILTFVGCFFAALLEPKLGDKRGPFDGEAKTYHLAIVAVVVMLVDLGMSAFSLMTLLVSGWWKTITAALCLKYCLLSFLLSFAEALLTLQWCSRTCLAWIPATLRLWVYSHRMAMDMITCVVIFVPLTFFVAISKIRRCLGIRCSISNLIVYRDSGARGALVAQVNSDTDGAGTVTPRGGSPTAAAPAAATGAAGVAMDAARNGAAASGAAGSSARAAGSDKGAASPSPQQQLQTFVPANPRTPPPVRRPQGQAKSEPRPRDDMRQPLTADLEDDVVGDDDPVGDAKESLGRGSNSRK
mmetsp:Transcript_34276/g.80110  ORF Transcript_34276/g.80110 Transcript_34276/m.80110 type:complete len:2155 (+) Transcript_34276:54-6518(+)